MLERLASRTRLTAAFAAALVVVLALAGLFVYLRVKSDLDSTINDGLRTRADDLAALAASSGDRPPDVTTGRQTEGEEGFSQILTSDGRVVASSLSPGVGPALDAGEVSRASQESLLIEGSEVPGIEGTARILARPAQLGNKEVIVVAGASTQDRNEALDGLRSAFLVGAPIAVLLISGLGYLLAGLALAPVTAALKRERAFVADASHELRTPLSILRTELELADRQKRSPEELREALRSAAEEVERLSQLAEDLLVIARSDQGELPIARQRVELRSLLERTRERFARRAAVAGRELDVDAPAHAEAELDPLRMEQALGNLVDNALRHGEGEIRISATVADGSAVLEVSDQGAGFPDGFEQHAFERFSRADHGRTGGGAGLGLSIVRAIAAAHSGEAAVAGSGRPATVRITVPLRSRG